MSFCWENCNVQFSGINESHLCRGPLDLKTSGVWWSFLDISRVRCMSFSLGREAHFAPSPTLCLRCRANPGLPEEDENFGQKQAGLHQMCVHPPRQSQQEVHSRPLQIEEHEDHRRPQTHAAHAADQNALGVVKVVRQLSRLEGEDRADEDEDQVERQRRPERGQVVSARRHNQRPFRCSHFVGWSWRVDEVEVESEGHLKS